jgi:hypothetical protein
VNKKAGQRANNVNKEGGRSRKGGDKRKRRKRGRPHRHEEYAFDARDLDRLLVHGEREDGKVRYPSYRELAARFGVSLGLIGRYATEHSCQERRRRAEWEGDEPPEIMADPAQVEAAEQLDQALSARGADEASEGFAVERILRMAEQWLGHLEDAINEGRLRPDIADLERFIRVIRQAKAQPDERAGIPEGMPTLEELQDLYEENLRREREHTPAMCGRLPIGTIPISWVRANEEQLRTMLATLDAARDRPAGPRDATPSC